MHTLVRWLARANAFLTTVALGISATALMATVILINVEVLGRYVLRYSTLVADEFAGYFFAWATCLSLAYALRNGQFLRVSFIINRVAPKWRRPVVAATNFGGVLLALVASWGCLQLFQTSLQFGTVSLHASRTPLAWIQIGLVAGFILLASVYLELFLRSVMGVSDATDLPDRELL